MTALTDIGFPSLLILLICWKALDNLIKKTILTWPAFPICVALTTLLSETRIPSRQKYEEKNPRNTDTLITCSIFDIFFKWMSFFSLKTICVHIWWLIVQWTSLPRNVAISRSLIMIHSVVWNIILCSTFW